MPSISNISFSVKFDLTGTPTLELTDTSTHGLTRTAIFNVTQPDGYTVSGSWSAPDLDTGETVFTTALRMASDGYPQCGNYIIEMVVDSDGYTPTVFSRTFALDWAQPAEKITKSLDVFTPMLQVIDETAYAVSGFNVTISSRNWLVVSAPTGTMTGSGVTFSLMSGGQFYSTDYDLTYTALVSYVSITNAWLSVVYDVYHQEDFSVSAPPTMGEIVNLISALRGYNECKACCSGDFERGMALYQLILNKLATGNTTNIYLDLQDLINIIGGDITNVTNTIINEYDAGGTGTIPPSTSGFAITIGNGADNVYAIVHGLNSTDIHVQVFDLSNGEKVYNDIFITGVNSINASFDDPVPVNRYRVIVLRA